MDPGRKKGFRPFSLIFMLAGLAGAACGLTLLYLGMREVMEIGGACAEGGAYQIRQPCPDGVPGLMVGGVLGGLVCLAVFGISAARLPGGYGRLVLWAWPALFISLGWNFLEYGLNPPNDEGTVASWIFCAVLFFLMGGLPLIYLLWPSQLRATFWPREEDEENRPLPLPARPLRSRSAPTPSSRAASPADSGFPASSAFIPGFQADSKPSDDMVGRLERLAKLRSTGALDEGEYERAKQAILREGAL